MALDWIKKVTKEQPRFWEDYLACFSKDPLKNEPKRYVVFDCETTGPDTEKDVILSIGALAIQDNRIFVNDSLELYLIQKHFNPETAVIHGITKNGREGKIVEAEAVIRFLDYIKNATLIGHQIHFDIEMVHEALRRLGLGKLKNEIMDTEAMYRMWKSLPEDHHSSLDDLCREFRIPKNDRHTAPGNAFITALLFLKIRKKLSIRL